MTLIFFPPGWSSCEILRWFSQRGIERGQWRPGGPEKLNIVEAWPPVSEPVPAWIPGQPNQTNTMKVEQLLNAALGEIAQRTDNLYREIARAGQKEPLADKLETLRQIKNVAPWLPRVIAAGALDSFAYHAARRLPGLLDAAAQVALNAECDCGEADCPYCRLSAEIKACQEADL